MGLFDFLFNKKVDGTYTPSAAGHTGRNAASDDDSDCRGREDVIRARIEAVACEDWPSYELRRDIPAAEFGGGSDDRGFEYGLYLDGQPKVMIMILNQGQYRDCSVVQSHALCRSRGVASFHLMKHLPNRKTYIADRMKALIL